MAQPQANDRCEVTSPPYSESWASTPAEAGVALEIELQRAPHSTPAFQQCQPDTAARRLDRQPHNGMRRLTSRLSRPEQHSQGASTLGRQLQPPDLLRLGLQRPRHDNVARTRSERLLERPQIPP